MKAARERGQRRPINRPCSACGDGDTEMRDHLHYPPFADEAAVEPSCTLCGAGMILVYKCRSCGATSDLNEIPSDLRDANRRLAESLEKCQGQNSLLIAGRNEVEAELASVKAELKAEREAGRKR